MLETALSPLQLIAGDGVGNVRHIASITVFLMALLISVLNLKKNISVCFFIRYPAPYTTTLLHPH